MKQQVVRFSLHQNSKVFGVLMAVSSLLFIIPASLVFAFAPADPNAPPGWVFWFFPIIYLVFGYICVAVGCSIYNFAYRFIGGIEYETRPKV